MLKSIGIDVSKNSLDVALYQGYLMFGQNQIKSQLWFRKILLIQKFYYQQLNYPALNFL